MLASNSQKSKKPPTQAAFTLPFGRFWNMLWQRKTCPSRQRCSDCGKRLSSEEYPQQERVYQHLSQNGHPNRNWKLSRGFPSKTLEGKRPISNTEDEATIGKTTNMGNKETLASKDPDDKPSRALKRRIKPMIPERNYEREYYKLQGAYRRDCFA